MRVSSREWLSARDEFHVKLADIEAQIQEDTCSYIEDLRSAGQIVRVDSARRELNKLHDFLTDCQDIANGEAPPQPPRSGVTSSVKPVSAQSGVTASQENQIQPKKGGPGMGRSSVLRVSNLMLSLFKIKLVALTQGPRGVGLLGFPPLNKPLCYVRRLLSKSKHQVSE